MSSNLPDFDKAEYVGQHPDQIVSGDVETFEERADHVRFVHAITYGIAAAIVGSILYAAFTILTNIVIGYFAVGVGYLVGKAMLHATQGLGGRKFQIASAVLTYIGVSMAAVPEILWAFHKKGADLSHIGARGMFALAEYGIASPILRLQRNVGSGLIGLFILFIGIRFAWRMTADRRLPQ
ncbi:hypothetical protein HDF16_003208 [Granulicella aggregans]|uniref:Uncharacterized protein n=1 Tax=Granulicella aggregans TaxID=474949 RepID=A0A7W7ZEL9_9BACT|nr:hypothetical protein [Granulicella aggregans]MBB5058494.1 hypothetical protein [Granulicella aggregans]